MKFHKGLRFKLALLYTLITAASLGGFSIYQYFSLWNEMLENLDNRILDELEEFKREYPLTPAGMETYVKQIAAQNAKVPLQPALFSQFADASGRVIACSEATHTFELLVSKETFRAAMKGAIVFQTVTGKYDWPIRVLATRLDTPDGRPVFFQLGVSIRRLILTTRGFATNLLVATILLTFFSVVVGWFMAKRSLRPVAKIIQTVQAITAERLQERLEPVGSGDEIDELIHTLNEMIERLERAFKQISQFTADVSHELRTPLAVMRGEMEVALEYGKTVEELREVLASSLEELDRLSSIANDLLLLARADAQLGLEHFEEVDLKEVLAEVISDTTVLAQYRGITFTASELPPAVMMGNRDALRRIFINLVDNALKYTPPGGQVRLSCEVHNRTARVTVADTGIGISPQDLPHIFDRFYKASHSPQSKDDKGVGLGLSIAKALVEEHGGKIAVESVPQRGTTFNVTLPLLGSKRG